MPILVSIRIAFVSSIIVFFIGIAAAWFMTKKKFPGKTLVETVLILPLVLPPTVTGFLLLYSLGRRSWVGKIMESLFNTPLLFTWYAAVIASVIITFPLVYQLIKAGLASVDRELEDAARSSGASEWQVFRYITLPLSFRFLISAYILGFARGLGEFGATLMIAGNIPGKTQTVPLAIYVAVGSGNMKLAWYWSLSVLIISFVFLSIVNKLK
ncbi:molybdate ABC transporter permease subunit [Thermosediminibacter litoriperuensis]